MNRFRRSLVLAALVAAAAAAPARSNHEKDGVAHLPSAEVKAGFAKGAVLVDRGHYMVHASRRDAAGQAEVHRLDTDIIYVLEGSATLVTGGRVVEPKTTAPDEIRGSAIERGDSRRLQVGDVVVVPNGTPHWFKEVEAPLLYYVVKVR